MQSLYLASGVHIDGGTVSALFDIPIAVALAEPKVVDHLLFEEERDYLKNCVRKRRAEFGTARLCARIALADIGGPDTSLVPFPDRSPYWPTGYLGSISHTDEVCAVVAARAKHARSIGLDIETDSPLDVDYFRYILTQQELEILRSHPDSERGKIAKIYFSAKEAFYKCQYPTTKRFLDFKQVELDINLESRSYCISWVDLPKTQQSLVNEISGRIVYRLVSREFSKQHFATAALYQGLDDQQ